jgi:Tfp pilus assembly protein PilN
MRRSDALNLARRSFVNTRPVARVALLLWLLSAVLLAANVALFWDYFSGSTEQRARLNRVEDEIARAEQDTGRLDQQVGQLDLARQNERVLFLNDKIADRTFSWSLLFDRVAEALPAEVRLTRLTPVGVVEQGSNRRGFRRRPAVRRGATTQGGGQGGAAEPGRVVLTIGGEAKNDEALLHFVDNLFSHPAFSEPNLTHESREDDGDIVFDLQVGYLPEASGASGETATVEEVAPPAAPAPAGTESTEPVPPPAGTPAPQVPPPQPRAAKPPAPRQPAAPGGTTPETGGPTR